MSHPTVYFSSVELVRFLRLGADGVCGSSLFNICCYSEMVMRKVALSSLPLPNFVASHSAISRHD
jgi:hypothetical protein